MKRLMILRLSCWFLVTAILAACSPAYLNKQLNDLHIPVENRVLNHNPQTESFLLPVISTELGEQPKAKNVAHATPSTNGYFVGLAISGGG
jgi:hypothetical protein